MVAVGGGDDDGGAANERAARHSRRACAARRSRPSDPDVSAWVSANAGSGKTHVLAQRVIRLLLDGVDPAKILCITFTKAAAANMANRVFDTLARWTALDDAALDAAIREIGERTADASAPRAGAAAVRRGAGNAGRPEGADHPRLLHAAAAAVPVRGQCRGALRRARRAPPTRSCSSELTHGGAARCGRAIPDSALGRALATAIAAAADQTFTDVVGEAIGKRDAVTRWIDAAGSVDAAIGELCAALGVEPDDTIEQRRSRDSSTGR